MASKEPTDVGIEHPVHLAFRQAHPQRIEGLMAVAARPKSIAETEEVLFVNLFEHGFHGLLDNLVFQGRDPQRALTSVRLGNPCPFRGLCPVTAAVDAP